MAMETKEDQETLRLLVQRVTHAFDDANHPLFVEQLARYLRNFSLQDDALTGGMGLQPKELNKLQAMLSNDSLVKMYHQNELKNGTQWSVLRQYYWRNYIDFWHFCNVADRENGTHFQRADPSQSTTPVLANADAENTLWRVDEMKGFGDQVRSLQEGLQRSEGMTLPTLKVAGANGMRREDEKVDVMMALDEDQHTTNRAEVRRHQDALPAWHLKSTITDDMVALSVNENARDATAVGTGDQMAFIEEFAGHEPLDECWACGRCNSCGIRDVRPVLAVASVQPPPPATGLSSTSQCSLAVAAAQDSDEEDDDKNFHQRQQSEGGQDKAQSNPERYRWDRWTADEWKRVFGVEQDTLQGVSAESKVPEDDPMVMVASNPTPYS
ncbi:hypothetical protein NLJ89_g4349 [Agrocybe chaxingu]|uniref:Uncharacterized protein n=1 Tax=Agrocybe chaxingu TaxID=84603 RepID=A0A9W8K466_9AGAR|nr:hypothetical protein NLJ89_g4349 [Agrocybe chaxingu]